MNSSFAKRAAEWDLEREFESKQRNQKKQKTSNRLPIKTAEGVVERESQPNDEDDAGTASSVDGLDDETPPTDDVEEESKPHMSTREEIIEAQEELAKTAGLINEAPEEHIGGLRTLATITASRNATVTKLGLVTQCAVFKDIIPGYRIRPASEEEKTGQLSKDVRRLRNFEQSIVGGYQKYVKELQRVAALPKTATTAAGLSSIALRCACDLVNSVPHFNFRTELLHILVNKLSQKKIDADYIMCQEALEKLFEEDEEGNATLEAVTILSKMIKGKRYRVHENVLNTFLHLRLLTEFSHKASNEKIERSDQKPVSNKDMKKIKQRMSKKQKKQEKERKQIEKEMKEADATVSYEQRDQKQGETLKTVFGVYFRILKERVQSLMGAVLEGLVKYAHLINQDFFGDILEALRELITEMEMPDEGADEDEDALQEMAVDQGPRNVARESLLCVITAFALLQGQDTTKAASTLHLDLDFFITHLYGTLYPAALNADLELGRKSVHLADPDSDAPAPLRTKVNVQTTIVLLLRSLSAVLLPSNARSVPSARLAAFVKQVLTASLQMPEKSSVAMLGLLNQVSKMHKKRIAGLWNTEERRGDGVFDPLQRRIEGSNPFASTAWEGELLRLHYAPDVREGARNLEKSIAEVMS